ncbi:MAG: PPOX class F420-dependent oxidoreductase [Acidimicrobiia bacterium]|nr:PPOX class F420-dependent oxidoreductase [Acidimicrobiia bacterium]
MDLDAAQDFVREHHRAVLVTRRSDGSLQSSPVVAGVDGSGAVVVSTRETAMKARNLRRDPRATLCVFTEGFYGPWVQVDGTATVVPLPEAMEPLVELYRQVAGEHPDWEEFRRAMVEERRVVVRLAPERAGPDRAG